MAWERWQEWYEDYKQQQFLLLGGLNRFRNRMLSMAWEQWQVHECLHHSFITLSCDDDFSGSSGTLKSRMSNFSWVEP